MNHYTYRPRGVCASQIRFDLEDGKLLEGADADYAVRTLKGNDCGGRGTSCADQLTKAIESALRQEAQA